MALTQVSSEGIKDAQVKTADILDANITTAKVADNAITGAKVADNLDIPDNNKIRFGTGNDLEIYHDGSDSRIHNTGTGNIIIKGDDVHIQGDNGENMANFNEDAGVQIRYDGTTKFETTSTGVKINNRFEMVNGSIADNLAGGNNFGLSFNGDGLRPTDGSHTESNNSHDLGNSSKRWRNLWIGNDIDVLDNGKILLGDDDDLQIYHDGSDSYIDDAGTGDLCIRGSTIYLQKYTGENCAKFVADGAVELYHNNSKKFETNANGCLLRDDVKLTFGDDTDFQLYHLNGGYAYLRDFSGIFYLQTNNFTVTNNAGDETILQGLNNGAVSLYYDNSKKLETQSTGAKVTGDLRFADNGTAIFGDGDDAQIKFNGNDAKFTSAGKIQLYPDGDLEILDNASGEARAKFKDNGAVELYYDNEQVFQTLPEGIKVTGGAENEEAVVQVAYSTVPTQLSSSYDGTWGESFFSINKWRNSDGSASWSASNNTSYASAAIGLNAGTSNSNIQMYTAASPNTNPTSKFEVWSTGDVNVVDGNLRVASGHGINFSATGDAGNSGTTSNELFADYEEGTFTPRMGGASNASTVYANGSGSYTRIGRQVTIVCRWDGMHESTMSGQIIIFNLPFGVSDYGSNYATSQNWLGHSVNWVGNDNAQCGFMTDSTNNRWTGYQSKDNQAWIDWDSSNFTSNGVYFNFQGTYWT
jgi:hypothetical protein